MKYNKAKHSVAFVLAALLACQPVSAAAITFADMNQVPWPGAETSINKAAELGLVVGETINGKSYFRPRDSVSLAESCQLAYKLLIQTGKASSDSSITEKWSTVLTTYGIHEWAHPAISFCLEEGIISISNLGSFMKNGSNLPATREQAVTILGRALTTGVSSYTANATSTKFNDNGSISSEAKPYVALLNEVGVVNGDDTNKFNPKSTLNRTETAVLVSNLYKVLDEAAAPVVTPTITSQSGTIKDMNSLYVNFENSNAYYLFSTSGVTVTLNGDSSSVSELLTLFKDGGTITATLTLDSNTRVTKLAATSDDTEKTTEKETEGTLTKVKYDEDDDDGYIVINKTSTYTIDDAGDVDIEIDDDEYDLEELYDLFEECEEDDKTIEVEVTLNSKGKLTKIVGSVEDDDAVKGEVKSMSYDEDDEEGSIKIGSKTYEVEDTSDVTVKIDGKTEDFEELYDLYEDDEYLYVTLTLDDDDYITKIVASTEEEDAEEEVEGEVEKVEWDEDEDEGSIKVDGDTYDAPDTEDVEIEIQDGDTELDSWEELYYAFKDGKEIEVELVVDGDEVTEITGKVTVTKGYLVGFGDDYLKLEGKKSEDSFKYYFTEYDRDDEDEEEDWEDDAKDIDVNGLNNIDNLYDFYDVWLDDDDTDLDDDVFEMKITLDDDGFIVEIDADLT
ncbi:S-layer homology domain-containing protein [Anaerotignum sp.]|nr:S-layer homology domain-containing protein [Anaerotignum sp.]MBQ7758598.1 S-layer homology domain-containing protein [Anaerotignum sp.]